MAILCLGFGIGLNATIFSIVDGVLLQPYPYPDPDRLLVIGEQNPKSDTRAVVVLSRSAGHPGSDDSTFSAVAATSSRSLVVTDGAGDPERYLGAAVSANLFPMLGASPILGHGFAPDDDRHGGGGVVLLSYDMWTERYQNDRAVLRQNDRDQRRAVPRYWRDAAEIHVSDRAAAVDSAHAASRTANRGVFAACSRVGRMAPHVSRPRRRARAGRHSRSARRRISGDE